MTAVNSTDKHNGTALWYEGVAHVTSTLGGQEGAGAVGICETMMGAIGKVERPPGYVAGVTAACRAVIKAGGALGKPRKTVRR